MTASISGADRSPFSTTAGSQVTVKIPCEEGKEQVPAGPLLIKDGQRDRGIRCKVHGRTQEKFGVRCRKEGRGQCLGMPQGVQQDSDSAPQPQTCSCSTRPPGSVGSQHEGTTTTRGVQRAWEGRLVHSLAANRYNLSTRRPYSVLSYSPVMRTMPGYRFPNFYKGFKAPAMLHLGSKSPKATTRLVTSLKALARCPSGLQSSSTARLPGLSPSERSPPASGPRSTHV